MAAVEFAQARRLLFVRLGKLGDLMVGLWLIRQARRARPDLAIGLVALPRVRELVLAEKGIDAFYWWRPWGFPLTAARLRLGRWDLLVDLNDSASRSSALIARLAGAGHSIAFRHGRYGAAFDETVPAPPSSESHVLERLGCMATSLGMDWKKEGLRPACPLDAALESSVAGSLRSQAGGKGLVVALNLSAGHPSRYWAPQKWQALAAALLKASPRVRLLWLALPQDAALKASISAGLPAARQLSYAGGSFGSFCAAIKASQLLVSPDTSAVHAASAFQVPVLGLYPEAAWNFKSWAPYGTPHRALRSPQGGVDGLPLGPVKDAALALLKPLARAR